jgi:dihydroorotate dehydrogenase electron transfer subunit
MTCDLIEKNAIWHGPTNILTNICVAEKTFRLRFDAPELVSLLSPGQFVMLRLANTNDPLLGRPLAVYQSNETTGTIDVVYLVVGQMTERLSQLPAGTPLQVWGPLGNGFPIPRADHFLMIAGGIGQTPFYILAEESLGYRNFANRKNVAAKKVSLLLGAKNKNRLCCLDDFRELGVDVQVATEDGSEGVRGFVTDLITPAIRDANLPNTVLACCGPRAMLRAAYETAKSLGDLPCYVSLESPMACGLGICFSCVVKYRDEHGMIDDVRTCTEGPVFDAYRLVW